MAVPQLRIFLVAMEKKVHFSNIFKFTEERMKAVLMPIVMKK